MIPELPTYLPNRKLRRRRKAVSKVAKVKSTQKLKKKIKFDSISCPICFDHICVDEVASTMCGHIFCTDCIKRSLRSNKSCPKCRRKLSTNGYHHLYFEASSDPCYPEKIVKEDEKIATTKTSINNNP